MSAPESGAHALERFFNPRRVAFVGATDDLAKFGGRCLANLLNFGFAGEVFPVNPSRREILGRRCYAAIEELPAVPDHVGIALPAAAAVDALERLSLIHI